LHLPFRTSMPSSSCITTASYLVRSNALVFEDNQARLIDNVPVAVVAFKAELGCTSWPQSPTLGMPAPGVIWTLAIPALISATLHTLRHLPHKQNSRTTESLSASGAFGVSTPESAVMNRGGEGSSTGRVRRRRWTSVSPFNLTVDPLWSHLMLLTSS